MRKSCDRVPVTALGCCGRPRNSLKGQSFMDIRVIGNIEIIIEVNEFIIFYLPKGDQSEQGEKERDEKSQRLGMEKRDLGTLLVANLWVVHNSLSI